MRSNICLALRQRHHGPLPRAYRPPGAVTRISKGVSNVCTNNSSEKGAGKLTTGLDNPWIRRSDNLEELQ